MGSVFVPAPASPRAGAWLPVHDGLDPDAVEAAAVANLKAWCRARRLVIIGPIEVDALDAEGLAAALGLEPGTPVVAVSAAVLHASSLS